MVGSDMSAFFAAKVRAAGGDPAKVQLVRFGAMAKVGGVSVATVPAVHTNGVAADFLEKNLADTLRANGLTAHVGPPTGYVLKFSNGLVVYLSYRHVEGDLTLRNPTNGAIADSPLCCQRRAAHRERSRRGFSLCERVSAAVGEEATRSNFTA